MNIDHLDPLDFVLSDAANFGCKDEFMDLARNQNDSTIRNRYHSCVISKLDSRAAKCLPEQAITNSLQDETDQKIKECFQHDGNTKKAKASYVALFRAIDTSGSAATAFSKHLKRSITSDEISDVDQINIERHKYIVTNRCKKEALDLIDCKENNLPKHIKTLAINKWNTCLHIGLCTQSVQNCLARKSNMNDTTLVWKYSSINDALDCLDDDPKVAKCINTFQTYEGV